MSALLRLEKVGKRYGRDRNVLTGVDLELARGSAVGVLGGNGSGKSTLLRIIARLAPPSTGRVHGAPVTSYVPDRFPARQRMSALSYLGHLGRIRGMPGARADRRGAELLERLVLAGGPNAPLHTLSKGNAQKVGIAQALLVVPELAVLDEPWSGLDPSAREVLTDLVTELVADGVCVVCTDHRPDFLRALATESHRLDAGALCPVPSAPRRPVAHVLLTAAEPPDTAWPPQVRTRWRGDRLELVVDLADRDAVLATALREGWSVLSVRSEEIEDPTCSR